MANFTNNTTQLQNLLVKVNELPEAGSGGSTAAPENCTVTLRNFGLVNRILYSSFEDGEYKAYTQSTHTIETTTFTATRGSAVILMAVDDVVEDLVTENCTLQYAEYESGFGVELIGLTIDGDNAYIEC